MRPILGPPLASLGQRMATLTHGPKTGKDGQETGKEKPHAVGRGAWLAWRYGVRFGGWWLVSQYS